MYSLGQPRILYQGKSKFNEFMVTEDGSIRTLWTGNGDKSRARQTVMDVQHPLKPQLEYSKNMLCGLALCPQAKSILMLGLGGGYLPQIVYDIFQSARIDVIEIDKHIVKIAKKYFNFRSTPRLKIHIEDACEFIKKTNDSYDIVFMDAYFGGEIPSAMQNIDYFFEVKKKIQHKGALVINLFSSNQPFYENMMNKISPIFDHLWTIPCKESANTIVFATDYEHNQKELKQRMNQIKNSFNLF